MQTYYCSDPHAFHGNIMKYCRRLDFMTDADRETFLSREATGDADWFRVSDESVDRMNRGLAENINARVKPDDTLWCLGDWVFGKGRRYFERARWFRDRIRCRNVHLVWGNHDHAIAELFASTHHQVEIQDRGVSLILNHYPMLSWNRWHHATMSRPIVHLYGHVHGLYENNPDAHPLKDPSAWPALDVGFDAHDYQVWSLDEVMERLRPRLEALEAKRQIPRRPLRVGENRFPGVKA